MSKKREWQITLLPEMIDRADPNTFKEEFRRCARKYDICMDCPYLLFHHIQRHHKDKLFGLVVDNDVFNIPKTTGVGSNSR